MNVNDVSKLRMNIPVALCSHKPALHARAAISLCSCIAGPVQPYMSTDETSESEHEEVAKNTEGKASKSKKLHGGRLFHGISLRQLGACSLSALCFESENAKASAPPLAEILSAR